MKAVISADRVSLCFHLDQCEPKGSVDVPYHGGMWLGRIHSTHMRDCANQQVPCIGGVRHECNVS
jgi:hypothetical protein